MNQSMLKSGKLLKDKEEMLRTVAECNLIMTDVLARVAVTDKFDIAWKDEHYGRIFDKLRDDYEVEERKEFLDEKVFVCTSPAFSCLPHTASWAVASCAPPAGL